MDLNKVMIIGRLTRDPELRSLPSGKSVASCGLATSRQSVERHGGAIGIESRVGEGTTVTVSLPLQPGERDGGP